MTKTTHYFNSPVNFQNSVSVANSVTVSNNVTIANVLSVNTVNANGSLGTSKQVLTSNDIGGAYWSDLFDPIAASIIFGSGGSTSTAQSTIANGSVVFQDSFNIAGANTFSYNKITDTLTSNNVQITGDLTVQGTTITVESLALSNVFIILNEDQASNVAPTLNSGFIINRGSEPNVQFMWDETNNNWSTNNQPLAVGNIITAGNTTVTGFVNASSGVNSSLITVGTTVIANTTGLFAPVIATAAINATSDNFYANTSALTIGNTSTNVALTINKIALAGVTELSNSGLVVGNGTYTQAVSINIANSSGNTVLNTTSINVSDSLGNTVLSASGVNIANSTGNAALNAVSFTLSNTTSAFFVANTSQILIGNTVALVANGAAGTNQQVLTSNSTGGVYWNTPSTVAGTNTQIQFNDSGALTGSADLTFNKTNGTLSANNVAPTTITAGGTVGSAGQILSSTGTGLSWITSGDITSVTASSPLTGGGTSGDVTIGMDISTAAGSYSGGISALTIDSYGRVTAATGTAGYLTSAVTSVAGTAGRITSSGGNTPTIDLATAGAGALTYSSGISSITVDAYGRVTSVSGSAGYVTTSGVTSVTGTIGRITSSGGATPVIDLATAGAGAATYSSGISSVSVDAYGRVTSVSGSAGYVTTSGVTSISAGTGLTSSTGGAITSTGTLSLTSGIVTAGTYSSPSSVTVDTYGRVTSITAGSGGSGVTSFNTRTGAVTLSSSDVTTALGYTPYNSTNPSGYISSVPNAATQVTSLGVGTAASGTTGEIRATNNITAYYTSDRRLKTNIHKIENALDILSKIDGVRYDWTQDYIDKRGGEDGYFVRKHDIGVIAQDIEAVLPEIVGENNEGYKGVRYERIVSVLIEAVKELAARVEELESK